MAKSRCRVKRRAKAKRRAVRKSKSRGARRSVEQRDGDLPFPFGWGGVRQGAGRKRAPRSGVPHVARPALYRGNPVHLTWRLVEGLPSLRRPELARVLREAFEGGRERFGFRLVQFSIQSNHLHLIAEAAHRRSLWRGMQGLGVRIAKRINKWLDRSGRVLADRYHAQQLDSPPQVRNTLRYVLNNALKHGVRCKLPDPCSSGPTFNGWSDYTPSPGAWAPVARARTWLLEEGWRREGEIALNEAPVGSG